MTWTTQPRSKIGPLAAITAGEGPLIVLIHGVGLRAEAWAPLITHFAASHRVVAVDMPGHGESALVPGLNSVRDYTTALMQTLDRPALVVGHSMGAMIALDLATHLPDRVVGVGALNAVFQRTPEAARAVQTRADQLDGQSMADPGPTLNRWFNVAQTPERSACETWLRSVSPAGYKAAYSVFAHHTGPSLADLAAMHRPVLFMTGADEPNSTPAMSHAMADLTPLGRAQTVPKAAHMMPMTHPTPVTHALLALAQRAHGPK